MTDKERLAQFDALFAKLQHNRSKVPLEDLRGKYSKAYNALVAELEQEARWWADTYLACLYFPLDLTGDAAGREWYFKKRQAIIDAAEKPGGLYEQQRKALIEDLDRPKFEDLVYRLYEQILTKAFDPYWQRHNKWVGQPGNRWIYNDIFKKFWLPPKEDQQIGNIRGTIAGAWINSDYTGHDTRFPPSIGPDPEATKGEKTDGNL